jgi:pimeloyl-ACP methyl ester carboxylesterase
VENLAAPFAPPALTLCGRQDAIVGYRDAWPVIGDYPHATFAVLDWGGHIVAPARPDLFRALVVDWLDRIEATADS